MLIMSLPEEIEDDGPDARAFGEVVEVGLEDVLDIGQVGGDDTPDVARVAEDEGVWRGVGEGVGYPVVESVPVLEKLGEVAEHAVRLDVIMRTTTMLLVAVEFEGK